MDHLRERGDRAAGEHCLEDSRSPHVTGYGVLRSTNGSSYSAIGTVSADSAFYSDSTVQGLGTTYWYEIEALSPYGSVRSHSVSATTPLTCLSSGPARGESGGNVQKADRRGANGDGGDVGLGVYLDDVYGAYRAIVADLVSSLE